MKKITILLVMLVAIVATVFAQDSYPVNFDKTTLNGRVADGRVTNFVKLGDQTINFTADATTTVYRDLTTETTETFTFATGQSVAPTIGYTGTWMHGFVFIDLNNDGSFTSDELVSYLNYDPNGPGGTGNALRNNNQTLPEFTLPTEAGTYRMRYMVDWQVDAANVNPGGTSDIVANGGSITDATLVLTDGYNVTYKVVDGSNNVLLAEKTVKVATGETITDIPDDMKRPFTTYSYSPESLTVNSEGEFVATATFNLPFETSTSFGNATWYYVTLRGSKYVRVTSTEPYDTSNTNEETDAYQWAFSGNPYTGVKMYNKTTGASKTVTKDGNNPVLRDGEYTWEILPNLDGFVLKAPGTANWYINNSNGQAKFGYWDSTNGRTDDGGTFRLTKVPEGLSYIQNLDEMENGKVYAIYNVRGIWKFAENATSMSTEGVPSDLEAVCASPANAYQIGLVKQNDKFYIYNVAQGKYLAAGNKLYQSPLEAVTIEASTSSAAVSNYKWFFSFDSNHNINVSGGKVLIDSWKDHDGGNVNAIMVTDATYTVADALAAFTDYTQCITDYCAYKEITTDFVNHLGEMGYPKAGTTATTAFLDILDRNASGANTAEDWNTFMDKYNAVFAAENMKMPEVGNFYRIKGVVSGRYLQSSASPERSDRLGSTEDGTDATTIFYLDEGNKLLGYANGIYTYNTCEASALATNVENAQTYEITLRSMGIFAIKGSGFLYSWPTSENKPYYDRNGNTFHERCQMTIEEVTTLPITLRSTDGTNYFATFSAPVNVEISGASLNNVQKDGNTATFTTVNTNVLKAGVGVLLSGASASATATVITDEVDEADYGLKHYYAATAGTGDVTKYYLGKSKKSGQAGFYKLGSGTTSNGFKAYLENTTGEAKEGFDLEFAGVTGIDNMENGTLNMENGAVYNLQGQRVNKAQKGVFIQNGKKVVLK